MRASGCSPPIISLMVSMAAALCAPQQAYANAVMVTIMGTVLDGTDYTGVFFGKNDPLGNTSFSLTYSIDDNAGVSCNANYSCIENKDVSQYMMQAELKIPAVTGNSFVWGKFPANKILQEVYRRLNYNGYILYLYFHANENYPNTSDITDAGSSNLVTNLYIKQTSVKPFTCWEEPLSLPKVAPDDLSEHNNNFLLWHYNYISGKKQNEQHATGTLKIESINIQPTQPPPMTCFER